MFGPSLLRTSHKEVLWPLLTPAGSATPFGVGYQVTWPVQQASPGKSVVFPSIYPPHLLLAAFGSKDFALLRKLIQLPLASPGVRGPRAGGLPPASFRFRLATDTLALS